MSFLTVEQRPNLIFRPQETQQSPGVSKAHLVQFPHCFITLLESRPLLPIPAVNEGCVITLPVGKLPERGYGSTTRVIRLELKPLVSFKSSKSHAFLRGFKKTLKSGPYKIK